MTTALEREPAASRHKCLIYDGHPSEQIPVIVPLLVGGLSESRRCLYLGEPEMVSLVRAALAAAGVDVAHEIGRGALILSSDRSHLDGGTFDPQAMVEMLSRTVDQAVRDGFAGLYATGDMRWELGPDENFARLREYEARLELVFREKPLSGVCQYRRGSVPDAAIQDALVTHRSAYLGRALSRDNLFYLPPELVLDGSDDARGRLAEWMWRQIGRIVRAEEERDRAMKTLEEANRTLEARVKERTAELESFGFSLTHDLRAPLRSIDGFAARLQARAGDALDAEGRDDLDRVRRAAARMSGFIDALLALFELTRRPMRVETVDLSALAEEALAELRRQSPGRAVETVVAPGLAARGDPRLIAAVLANLLGNAWKFTGETAAPRVEFGAGRRDGERVFFVRDNGAGFDMSQRDRLFEPFSRLHPAAQFPGNGIGLATVRRILARHGGEIWADSTPGRGSVFTFTLGREPAEAR